MAGLATIQLETRQENSHTVFVVRLQVLFSQREVDENFSYGVNVAVMRDDPSVVVVPIPRDTLGMQWSIIPPSAVTGFVVTTSNRLIQPGGQREMDIEFEIPHAPIASGTRHVAWAVVTPEIASMAFPSPSSTVP